MMQSPSCTSLVDAMETSFLFDSHEQEEQFVSDMLKPLDEDYPEKQIATEQTFPHLDKKQKVAEALNVVTPNPLNIAMPPQQLCTPYHFPLSRPSSPSPKRPSSPSGNPRLRKSASTTSIKSQYNKIPTHSSSSSSLPSGSPPSSPKSSPHGNKKGSRLPVFPLPPKSIPPRLWWRFLNKPIPTLPKISKGELDDLINSWVSEKQIALPTKRKNEDEQQPPQQQQQVDTRPSVEPKHSSKPKIDLFDLIAEEKDLTEMCNKALRYICDYLKVELAGMYIISSETGELIVTSGVPSRDDFASLFHSYKLLITAAVQQKQCLTVEVNEHMPARFSFVICPIIASSTGNEGLGAVVLRLPKNERDCVPIIEQMCVVISVMLTRLDTERKHAMLVQQLQNMMHENEQLRGQQQRSNFTGRLPVFQGCMCTSVFGFVTFASSEVLQFLGYTQSELVGVNYPCVNLIHAADWEAKIPMMKITKDLNLFQLFIELSCGKEVEWTLMHKSGAPLKAFISVEQMDDMSQLQGFVLNFKTYQQQAFTF